MPDRDLTQVESVFHAVLEIPPEDREEYLKEACNGDKSLYAEVSSLVSAFDSRGHFIEEPALNLGLEVLSRSSENSLIGKSIGPYKVLSRLGKGGMGEVYLAEDTKLGRKVALKFLSPEFVGDNWAKNQLVKEAQSVAMLDHLNICPVYGIEEIDSRTFIVMQYVEGETLADLLRKGLLKSEQIHSVARQIVDALTEAHAHGIIHRDIKPKNIMVTVSGVVKVLDFGLAKTIQSSRSLEVTEESISQFNQSGLVPGTIAYMSPEQLRGEKLDYLSDIFSVGTVLHEMVSGINPFARKSEAETISAILSEAPTFADDLPKEVRHIALTANKCLEKNKKDRAQSASQLLIIIDASIPETSHSRFGSVARHIALAAILVIVLSAIVFQYFRQSPNRKLAILPFSNRTGDTALDYISSGMGNNLIDRLSFASGLQVLKPTVVSGYKDRETDASIVGKQLDVDAVLTGHLIKDGEIIVLETRLIRTSDGEDLWQTRSTIQTAEMVKVQKDLSARIVRSLSASLGTDSDIGRTMGQTDNPDAFRLYLVGRTAWENGKMEDAITAFKQATELDSAFALAWSGLADSYAMQPTTAYGSVDSRVAMSKASAAARRALEAGDRLAEPHISMGIVKMRFEWEWQDAEQHFKRAIEIDPYRASAHVWYATLLTTTGRFDEAIRETEKAKELDPFNPVAVMSPGRAYYRARDFDKAINYLNEVLRENPNNRNAEYVLGYAYLKKGLLTQAIATFEKVATYNKWLASGPLGHSYAKNGQGPRAKEILREMDEQDRKTDPKEKKIPAQERAIIYIGLGDKDSAFSWLEKAYSERFPPITALTTEPIFDDLRSDPRFSDLARRINLKP